MRRIAAPVIVSLFLLASCGTKTNEIEIQLWNFGGTPNQIKWVRARVDSFQAKHPGLRVLLSLKSWNMIREILYTNYSANTGPDVMTVHANYAAEFGGSNFFYPINTFPDFPGVKSWYVPSLLEACRYGENYYGLPSSAIAFVLICNTELFAREGIRPPRTWSEFRNVARVLTKDLDGDGAIDQYGLVLMGGDRGGFSYRFAPFLFKAGVQFLSDDLTKATFNTPRGVAALQLFADMYQTDRSITPGFLAYTHSEINDLFCSNKVAMSIEGPWFRAMVGEKKPGKELTVVPIPVPDDLIGDYATAATLQDMVMMAMSAQSKHPAEAWEFLKYLRDEEADMAWIRSDLGAIATTRKALNSPEADAVRDLEIYRNELEHARPWPAHPRIIAIVNDILAPYGQKGIVGELTPKEALDEAARDAQKLLDERR